MSTSSFILTISISLPANILFVSILRTGTTPDTQLSLGNRLSGS